MKLITMILVSLFYIGCGQASGDTEGEGNFEEEVQENIEKTMVSESEVSNVSVTVNFKSSSAKFACKHAEATEGLSRKERKSEENQCFCEVRVNGKIAGFARNDKNWCAKKEAEFTSGQAMSYGNFSSDANVGKKCALKNSTTNKGMTSTTYVCGE